MMSQVQATPEAKEHTKTYEIQGQLLEVCDCNVLCPCWIGENPDGGTCNAILAWTIERGQINAVDVSGLIFALLPHIPGNVLDGNWKALAVVDDKATPEQQEAIVSVFTGQLGGPIADVAGLVGEIVGLERATMECEVKGGAGRIKIGEFAEAAMEPYKGATGKTTTLSETVFSTIPGSPAYVSKASSFTRNTQKYGLPDVNLQWHNAVQGHYHFEG
jgi:hypothetical protein